MMSRTSKTKFFERYDINEAAAYIPWKECQHLQNQSTEEVLSIQAWDCHRNWISYNPLEHTDIYE